MARILGLDLGTNSIGWAIVDKENNEFSLIDKGVRIFSEGVKSEKGIESSRAAERTGYRSARKIKYRRKLRKYETLKVLSLNGMCPLSVDEVEEWKKSGFKKYPLNPEFLKWLHTDEEKNVNPYYFRDKASKEKISLFELGRALYHIAQRRGFLSNRLDQSAEGIIELHRPNIEDKIFDISNIIDLQHEIKDYFEGLDILDKNSKDLDDGDKKLKSLYNALDKIIKSNLDVEKAKAEIIERLNRKEDQGAVKQKISEISQAMKEGHFSTLGQYFYSLYSRGKIRNQYTAREEHYLKEFEIICETQNIEGIDKNEQLPEKRYSGLTKDLYKAIFYQRPLKSQKGLIGKCSLEKSKTRCAVSHPDFEEYRMWTYINTIKSKTPEDETLRFLTTDEREKIVPKFYRKKDHFNFEDLAKELVPNGFKFEFYKSSNVKSVHYLFNYKPKDTVSGCVVSASLKNVLGDDWKTKKFSFQTTDREGKQVQRNVDYKDLWHLLSVSTSDLYLEEYAKEKLGLDEKRAKSFSKIRLKKDFASLSLNAISKVLPYLKQGLLYSHAVFMANIENIVDDNIWNDPNQREYIKGKIAELIENNTYENSLLEVINGLIKECKEDKAYYSKEAEASYKKDLEGKLRLVLKQFKKESELENVLTDLFPVFIEQLQKYEFIKIKRLDEKVLDFLKGENEDGEVFCSNPKRLEKLYHPSDIEVFKKKIIKDDLGNEKLVLGSPLTPSIKNPMAMRALHQLRKVLNTLILEGQIDEKTKIHIEMARELNDANRRKGIQDFQNDNKKFREEAIKEIKKLYFEECKREIEPTEDDLLRYQLWVEQNRQEIYEPTINGGVSKQISICQIIGSNPDYDIEHTIPRSISQDNSLMNKTLCSQNFNRTIKKRQMPVELNNYELLLPYVAHWKEEADNLSREIEMISRSIKAAVTKEAKDKKIRRRHYLTLRRDYLKGKYERFIWKEPKVGFKNSQIPDTGIITKYAQAYLKSYFNRVESVKGGMVAEFRKIWGIQESFQKDDKKYFVEKDRSKHTHHTIDAITIACMSKDKYDVLAQAWTMEDQENITEARKLLADSKPWKTFKEDLKRIEDEILVSHYTPDNVKKQSKRIVRVRGKKQFRDELLLDSNNNPIPVFGKRLTQQETYSKIEGQDYFKIGLNGKSRYYEFLKDKKGNVICRKVPLYQQGDTVRGSLHQESIYGAVKDPLNNEVIRYVIRKDLESLKANDVENIVDVVVKEKVKEAIANKVLLISSNAQQKNKLDGKIWMNEEKQVPINKVRIYANSVKNPLEIKEHSLLSKSKHEHKQKVYGQNDENYGIVIYEGIDKKGKVKRSYESINNKNAGQYYKLSNRDFKQNYDIVPNPEDKTGLPLKYILKKGMMVLFYRDSIDEIFELKNNELNKRLYKLVKFDAQGRLTFRPHFEARQASELKEYYSVDFEKPQEQIRLQVSKLNILVENHEFEMSSCGKIIFK